MCTPTTMSAGLFFTASLIASTYRSTSASGSFPLAFTRSRAAGSQSIAIATSSSWTYCAPAADSAAISSW
jgi:hypothetical protein